MALRVLLADESVTIKKVFQLSLKDYGVDVVTVTSGLDVLHVAKKSKPDIVFADVILQKKSGYDVCAELKKDPELKDVPFVLIWSGFMELDSNRFKACQADGDLEKPFDTAKLRQVIQSLVPKTKTQNIGSFLQFPRLPDFEEKKEESNILSFNNTATNAKPQPQAPEIQTSAGEGTSSAWSMDSFEPIHVPSGNTGITDESDIAELDLSETPDEFVPVDLPAAPAPSKAASLRTPVQTTPEVELSDDPEESDNQWVQRTLSKYKIQTPVENEDSDVEYQDPQEASSASIDPDTIVRNQMPTQVTASKTVDHNEDEIELDLPDSGSRAEAVPQLNEKQLEALIRAQSKEVIEKVVWQVVPEIATQIIEREIKKLLKERHDLGPR